jgi:hypothetical protein
MAGNSPGTVSEKVSSEGVLNSSVASSSQGLHSQLPRTLHQNGVPSPSMDSLPFKPSFSIASAPVQPFIPQDKVYKPLSERMDIGYSRVKTEEKTTGPSQGVITQGTHSFLPTKPNLFDRLDSQSLSRQLWQPSESGIPSLQSRIKIEPVSDMTGHHNFKPLTPIRSDRSDSVGKPADSDYSPSLQSRLN